MWKYIWEGKRQRIKISEKDRTQQTREEKKYNKKETLNTKEIKHGLVEKNGWKRWRNINWWYRSFEIGKMISQSDIENIDK